MASLRYLWAHRARFPISSARFYRAWGKRVFSLPELVSRNRQRSALARKGASIAETAEIGQADIQGRFDLLSIGANSFLGRVTIALHGKVQIGEHVCVNDGVEILTASHDVTDPEWKHVVAEITIEDYAWIGTGAMLLPGVRIGRGAVVGARAVVSKSVPPGAIVVGNPARPVPKSRCEEFSYNPCEFLAANRAWLLG
ncbi:acyltransferase [Tellurirhabdus rosea]|uniref:acyltransferase n=1 Tax=Tellurirhabdus rosea TaxID=2674997 RepID=UPI002B1CD653|nr:acyltransferase [Tellurirhabdus rosea]